MNLGEIRTRTRQAAGIRSEALMADDEVDRRINEVHADVVGTTDWGFLHAQSTVTSTGDEVVLPAPYRAVTAVKYAGRRLAPTTIDAIEAVYDDDDRDGHDPEMYAKIDNRTLRLFPEPDGNVDVTVRGLLAAVDMTVDTDTPMFDAEFAHILAYGAAARILSEFGDDSGRYDMYSQTVSDLLGRMIDHYQSRQDRTLSQWGGQARQRSPRSRFKVGRRNVWV